MVYDEVPEQRVAVVAVDLFLQVDVVHIYYNTQASEIFAKLQRRFSHRKPPFSVKPNNSYSTGDFDVIPTYFPSSIITAVVSCTVPYRAPSSGRLVAHQSYESPPESLDDSPVHPHLTRTQAHGVVLRCD